MCDRIIKKMVLHAGSGEEDVGHVYDLVRSLFDVVREVLKRSATASRKESLAATASDRVLSRNIGIIIAEFKKAAE